MSCGRIIEATEPTGPSVSLCVVCLSKARWSDARREKISSSYFDKKCTSSLERKLISERKQDIKEKKRGLKMEEG